MRKYNKKEYLKYVKELEEEYPGSDVRPIDFKTWKWVQPIADKAVGVSNEIIKKHVNKI